MKVRISFSLDVNDSQRRAISWLNESSDSLATRDEVREFFKSHGLEGMLDLSDAIREMQGDV